MTSRTRTSLVLLLALVLLGADAAPLTNEEIVRRVASGESTERILGLVASRAPGYDLDPEVLDEMVRAGVPRSVIAAMRARAAEAAPESAAPVPPPEPDAPPVLSVRIPPRTVLRVPARLPDDLRRALELPPLEDTASDLAVFVFCRTADHVPDRWRSSTPLGRDFVTAPRHAMHLFRSGASKEKDALVLPIPEVLEVPLEPEVAHDLGAGWAVKVGERWLAVAWTGAEGVVVGPRGLALDARLAAKTPGALPDLTISVPGAPAKATD